jgi:hypothetical protein
MHHAPWLSVAAGTAALAGLLSLARSSPATQVAEPGHYVLVVEGDRAALAVTAASRKADPWGGVPKGLVSTWSLAIHDADGGLLATVPLDVSPFAVDGPRGVRVEGCVVRDSRIGMLVNVPAFARAATYTFTRDDGGAVRHLGTTTASQVQQLAGGGR